MSVSSLENLEGDGCRSSSGFNYEEGLYYKVLATVPSYLKAWILQKPADPVKVAVLDNEVQQMVLKGAIERVPVGQACFHSHLLST